MFGGSAAHGNWIALPVTAGGVGGLQDATKGSLRGWQLPALLKKTSSSFDCARTTCAATSASDGGGHLADDRAAFSGPSHRQLNGPQQIRSRRVSPSVSILPVVSPSKDTEDSQSICGSLNNDIDELKELQRKLMRLSTVREKMTVLDSQERVQRVFGGLGGRFYVRPAIVLALTTLDETQLYLLKCLVAAGQEHVLDVPFNWAGDLEGRMQGEFDKCREMASLSMSQDHLLRDGFVVLAQMIEGRDSSGIKPDRSRNVMGTAAADNQLEGASWMGHDAGVTSPLHGTLLKLVNTLSKLEKFYNCIGGIIGYQVSVLELIKASALQRSVPPLQRATNGHCTADEKCFYVPVGPDLSEDLAYAAKAAAWGLQGLPQMGEIYPLGGAGDRLGLVDDVTGECLPVAMLPYNGRTLLEGLIRDLQAREYLHFRVFGEQQLTPVAIMTSAAKRNHGRVLELCEKLGWFGRGRENFKIFEQPLVPTVAAANGRWLTREPLTAVLKPGGHGVIWKLAKDSGVFEWFRQKGRSAAIVRQISNPVAGTDVTLLALSGIGLSQNKKFGFASCKRNVGTAEGVNVMVEKRSWDGGWDYGVTCIEYTEFNKLGIPDVPVSPGSMEAQYPANTNVLFVDLAAVEKLASCQSRESLPGMILNLKKPAVFEDYLGKQHSVIAGRLECTMQNIADFLTNTSSCRRSPNSPGDLDTFVTYNQRRKVTSSAKRRRKQNEHSLHQTPDGSFLDVTRNAYDLLRSCGVSMPVMESNHCYVDTAPPFAVFFHPALGPLWNVIRQKIRGGSVAGGSELQLEIAELLWEDVELSGSLIVHAKNVMGTSVNTRVGGEQIVRYGHGCGRCRLERVKVANEGVDWDCAENIFWQRKMKRLEALEIILEGDSEFEAVDTLFEGSHTFRVPDGYRMRVVGSDEGMAVLTNSYLSLANQRYHGDPWS